MHKPANSDFEIHPLLQSRWSPRAFSHREVESDKLRRLFEASRWSPSAGNEQPWAFVVVTRADPSHESFVDSLTGRNRLWASEAPVLAVAVARRTLTAKPDQANLWARYDLGQAVAHMSIQAGDLGLYVHQMAGFDADKVRAIAAIPDDYEPVSMIAIGYYGETESLPDELRERELAPRQRRPQSEFVFSESWGEPAEFTVAETVR